jgi:hypothetical protein
LKLTLKQKEQLKRPRPLLFLLVMAIFGSPWALLFWGGFQARQQQAQMAVRSGDFFNQFSSHPRNAAAKQFDRLSLDLGFSANDASDLRSQVNPEAKLAYEAIEKSLIRYLSTQTTKLGGPLDTLPPKLRTYLSRYGDLLTPLQDHILQSDSLQWEIDFARMSDGNYPFPGFVNVLNVQRLLLLSAIDHSQQQRSGEMLAALEASWQLNQAIAQRPDLVSQILVSVVSEQQAGILRHLENLPEPVSALWQRRLAQQIGHQSVLSGLEFDAWLQYQILQKSILPTAAYVTDEPTARLTNALAYWFSPAYYLRLTSIDNTQTVHRALERLSQLDVCSTSQTAIEQMLMQETTARWNRGRPIVPDVIAQRWKTSGDRALNLELTQKVLQAKQLSMQNHQWPSDMPNLASEVCPQAQWVYQRAADNSITLSLSVQLSPAPAVPLQYQSLPIQAVQ